MSQFFMDLIFILMIVVGIAACIWDAIPGILKVIAVISIIVAFVNMMKSK